MVGHRCIVDIPVLFRETVRGKALGAGRLRIEAVSVEVLTPTRVTVPVQGPKLPAVQRLEIHAQRWFS